MKKFVSVFLVLVFVFSLCVVPASAAVTRARTVSIYPTFRTIRKGNTLQLEERVSPSEVDYYQVDWSTSDYNIVDVDDMGEITGVAIGEAIITCRIYGDDENGKKIRLGTNSVTFKVVSSVAEDSLPTPSVGSSTNSSSSSGASSNAISTSDVNSAVKKALVRGTTTSATFKNIDRISASALQSAALTMQNGGGTVLLNFDTVNGKSVEGRLTLNPIAAKNVSGNIKLGVHTNDDAVAKTKTKFQKFFKNDVVIIKADHSGSYGMDVTYAVKIGSSLSKAKNLRLYSYDPDTNKYREISNANIRIDSNNYVHFTTQFGDYLVVSNGKLAK